MDKGAWWAAVPRVTKSQTQLNDLVCMQHDKGLQQMLQQKSRSLKLSHLGCLFI